MLSVRYCLSRLTGCWQWLGHTQCVSPAVPSQARYELYPLSQTRTSLAPFPLPLAPPDSCCLCHKTSQLDRARSALCQVTATLAFGQPPVVLPTPLDHQQGVSVPATLCCAALTVWPGHPVSVSCSLEALSCASSSQGSLPSAHCCYMDLPGHATLAGGLGLAHQCLASSLRQRAAPPLQPFTPIRATCMPLRLICCGLGLAARQRCVGAPCLGGGN